MKRTIRIGCLLSILSVMLMGCASFGGACCSKGCSTAQKKQMDNSLADKNVDTYGNEPVVCLLEGAAFIKRKEILQKEIFDKMSDVKELEDGYIFYFKYDEAFFMTLADYTISENKCCPFFTFDIKLHNTNDIQLKVTGPAPAKDMIKSLLPNK